MGTELLTYRSVNNSVPVTR